MKSTAAALVVLLSAALSVHAQEAGSWDARLAAVSGDVTVVAADGSPEVSGEANMPLEEGDRVVVGDGGSAEVALDGAGLITVRESSDFKLEKTAKGESSFFLAAGSLLAKIQKLGERRLRVRTPTAVASVRGTEFGVEVDGDNSHVGVFDQGKVEVTGSAGGAPELLISNQETSIPKGQAPAHAQQLQRFMARRGQMRGLGRRLSAIKAKWKALPPDQRRELRAKTMERMREHRKNMLLKRGAKKQEKQDKRQEAKRKSREKRDKNVLEMEKVRERLRKDKR
jgi:hypothetical protein